MNLLVIGSLAFDAIETPFGKSDKIVGGSATFISNAAAYFHRPVQLISVVGYDFPKETLEAMRQRGIELDAVEIRSDQKSFFWSGRYGNDLNTRQTIETQLNVLADFNPIVPVSYRNPDFVMMGNLSPIVQKNIIEQLTQRPKMIVLDTMNFWMDTMFEEVVAVIKRVDMLTINDEEARQLTGEYSLVKAAQKILSLGPRYLVIKKGEHGALLFHKDEIFYAPALPLEEVFDPTGAGDSFAGGLIGYLASAQDTSFENVKKAVIYGSAMASFCVERFGAERLLQLTKREIDERFQRFYRLVDFENIAIAN
jgi:sugar/nucleoside kinase (ribokinase family)